jgi:hypothetical protein
MKATITITGQVGSVAEIKKLLSPGFWIEEKKLPFYGIKLIYRTHKDARADLAMAWARIKADEPEVVKRGGATRSKNRLQYDAATAELHESRQTMKKI